MEPSVEYIYIGNRIESYFQQYNPRCLSMLNGDIVRVIFDDEFDVIDIDWKPRYALEEDRVAYSITCSRSQWKEMLAHFGGSLKETKRKVWNHEA